MKKNAPVATPLYTESLPVCRNRLLHLVSHRCWFYAAGSVPVEKAPQVAAKFAARRYAGPVHHVFLSVPAEERFVFWMLTARRESLEAFNETARDARRKHERLVLAGLELKKLVRTVRHSDGHKEVRDSLTWAMSKETRRSYLTNGRRFAAHASAERANRLLAQLAHLPGYSGVRAQRMAIYREMVTARNRMKPGQKPLTCPVDMKQWIDPVKFDATGLWKPFYEPEPRGDAHPCGAGSKPPAAAPGRSLGPNAGKAGREAAS